MRTRRDPRRARPYTLGPERTREGPGHCKSSPCQSKLLWNFVSHICICSLSGLSTAKLRPISSLQTRSYFGRVHLGLPSFNFLLSDFLSFRSRRACHNEAKLFTKSGTKNGPATQPHFWNLWGPFLWPFRNKVQWNWGAEIGPPKNTN